MNTKIENKYLETFIEVWQSNFISVESNKKITACLLSDFSSYSFFLYFAKVLVHNTFKNVLKTDSLSDAIIKCI